MRSVRRILIVQPYGIGDALFTTPLLRALRTLPTVEAIDLLLGSRTEAVFRSNPYVDQIFSLDKGAWHREGNRRMIQDTFSLWKNLRGQYDLLIDCSLQREYGFYGKFFLGIPRRIGFNFRNRSTFLTHALPLSNGFEGKHVIDFYCELGQWMDLEIEDRFVEFYLSQEDREEGEKVLRAKSVGRVGFQSRPFIAIAPGGGESWGKDAVFKRWPVTSFVKMISFLKARLDFENVLVLGSQEERILGEEIQNRRDDSANRSYNVVNLCGKISLAAAAALLEKSLFFLANDGGLVHLAHALRVPLIAFYGPVDPKVYGPYPETPEAIPLVRTGLPCRPCYFRFRYNSACSDRECLTDLHPEEAIEFLDQKKFWSKLCKKT